MSNKYTAVSLSPGLSVEFIKQIGIDLPPFTERVSTQLYVPRTNLLCNACFEFANNTEESTKLAMVSAMSFSKHRVLAIKHLPAYIFFVGSPCKLTARASEHCDDTPAISTVTFNAVYGDIAIIRGHSIEPYGLSILAGDYTKIVIVSRGEVT